MHRHPDAYQRHPYVVMLLIAILCVAAFPKVATWLPEQVLSHDAPRKAGGHSKI
jgi:hypothetical protein